MKIFILNFFFGAVALIYGLQANAQIDYRKAIEADKVHATIINNRQVMGQGILVAVIDTGIKNFHPDLTQKISNTESFNYHAQTTVVVDEHGHGTHVASSIVADRYGIAPAAKVLPIKLANSPTGGFTIDSLASAIRFAVDKGARIINLSLGGYFYGLKNVSKQLLISALQYADSRGVLLVVAAGNEGLDISSLAILPAGINNIHFNSVMNPQYIRNMIVVCAVDERNVIANFGNNKGSNYSMSQVDVCAPGTNIEGANSRYQLNFGRGSNGQAETVLMSGTSMATPIVSGVAALIWSINPNMSALQVKSYIINSAYHKRANYPQLHVFSKTGSVVNAFDALSLYIHDNPSFWP